MVSEKQKRQLRARRKSKLRKKIYLAPTVEQENKSKRKGLDRIYHDRYKELFIITTLLLIFSVLVIGHTYYTTGDFVHKGVSLSGGITMTIPTEGDSINVDFLAADLKSRFPEADFSVREISELGTQTGVTVEASTASGEGLDELEKSIFLMLEETRPNIRDVASTEVIGPSLGQSFFQQVFKAVLIALTFMGLVVFLYFGETKTQKAIVVVLTLLESVFIWNATGSLIVTGMAIVLGIVLIVMYTRFSIPSAAVILAAISTTLFTLAVIDIMGMRLSTAGIAAFLMLIGYSVDTDILLSTRVLKRSGGTVYERCVDTVKTGMTMEITTMIAAGVALIFSQSEIIREIMTIIFIGLFADIFFTWIQNVGILRWYLEKRAGK